MLFTGSTHTTDTIPCPRCGRTFPLGAMECPQCGLRIITIRKRRKSKRQPAHQAGACENNQNTWDTASISGRTAISSLHMVKSISYCCSEITSGL